MQSVMNELLVTVQLSVKSDKQCAVSGLSAPEMENNRRRGLKFWLR